LLNLKVKRFLIRRHLRVRYLHVNRYSYLTSINAKTMDLIQVFTNNRKNITVNIQGTLEDPLFQANQIGELLELKTSASQLLTLMKMKRA